MARLLKVFFHDACFDGTTSAALFAAFYRQVIDKDVELRPVGMIHRDGNPFEGVPLDADDHACVDFRFCADTRMRWWFDHHPTAFQPAETPTCTAAPAGTFAIAASRLAWSSRTL